MGRIDESGKKYGRLTVMEYDHSNKDDLAYWKCVCECGKEVVTAGRRLRNGEATSCGCSKRDRLVKMNKKHGYSKERLYSIYCDMIRRTSKEGKGNKKRYYHRGIRTCEEWMNSYEAFKTWAHANGYRDDLTIDRIDNNGNYCPNNCRWANKIEQANNTSLCVYYQYKGEKLSLSEISRRTGINRNTIGYRLKAGWSIEEALETTKRSRRG